MLTRIDDLLRPEYCYLSEHDECFFVREYTAQGGYQRSDTNQLILNFKKPVDRRGRPEWRYKEIAARELATELSSAMGNADLLTGTLVPMPPSKAKGDPLYDDRIVKLLQTINVAGNLDIRELLVRRVSREPVHVANSRPIPSEVMDNLAIDESVALPDPSLVCVVDDVLTTGCSFVAAKRLLDRRFPGVRVVGVYLARTIRDAPF